MKTINPSKPAEWESFERRVAEVLLLAGYRVDRDTLIGGGQTDLVATKTFGPATTRLIVECKYSQKATPVSVDAVENFASRVMVLRTKDLIDGGMMVTNGAFSRFAKSVPTGSYIQLMTMAQLYTAVFDLQPYLKELIEESNQSKLMSTFVRPLMRPLDYAGCDNDLDGLKERSPQRSIGGIDIVGFCDEWLADAASNRICILGEYGTGKTTFCRWYASYRARKCLESIEGAPVPLLIPLHRFTKAFDVDALITDFMVNKCSVNDFRLPAFNLLLAQGRFLLLLDGFDEMARHVDRDVRYQAIAELSKLARGRAKVILTGRPSYFPTDEELVEALGGSEQDDLYIAARNAYNELVDYQLYELEPFSRDQIQLFVSKHVPGKAEAQKVLTYIDSRYDISDLVTRPVLLEMVVKSLPRLLEIATKKVNAATLYDVYTGLWVDREQSKGEFRKLIRKEDKLRFMEELAFQLFTEDKTSISYRQLSEPIRTFFKVDDSDIDYFSHDIRTCSFLHRVPHQGYSFAHRSFQEFFLGKRLLRAVRLKESAPWSAKHLPSEVLRFTAELVLENDDRVKSQLLEWTLPKHNEILRSNALTVALLSRLVIPAKVLAAYGMNLQLLQSYAAFKVGDTAEAWQFINYLWSKVSDIARLTGKLSIGLNLSELDVAGDVVFKSNKLLRQSPIRMQSDLDKYMTQLILNEVGVARDRMAEMKREIGFADLEAEARARGFIFSIEDIPSHSLPLDESLEAKDMIRLLMSRLNPQEKRLINDYYFDEISVNAIAKDMNCHPNTIRVRLNRVLAKLRRRYGDYGDLLRE